MKTLIVLFLAVAAFAAPQVSTNPPANPLSAAGGANASPAAMECLSQCATTAFGVDAMSLTPDTIPCAKEYSGAGGYSSPAFKACICKDAKVKAATTCQGKCQYGTVISAGFGYFCK